MKSCLEQAVPGLPRPAGLSGYSCARGPFNTCTHWREVASGDWDPRAYGWEAGRWNEQKSEVNFENLKSMNCRHSYIESLFSRSVICRNIISLSLMTFFLTSTFNVMSWVIIQNRKLIRSLYEFQFIALPRGKVLLWKPIYISMHGLHINNDISLIH